MSNIYPIPAFKDNYIWTWINEKSKTAWVVDPGDALPVISVLNKHDLDLAGILLTHHHYDHSGGVGELLQTWKGAVVYGSFKSPIQEINHRLKEGDEIDCEPYRFRIMEIPGHTLDHIAIYNDEVLFCGDTLFSAGCGRVFEGTCDQMYHSLSRLISLPPHTSIYCGHEYTLANLSFAQKVEPLNPNIRTKIQQVTDKKITLPSTISAEMSFNPFFRCEQPDVIRAAEEYAQRSLSSSVEVFTVLRKWKNSL